MGQTRAKDIAETIKNYALIKGLYATYKTAMSGTIYLIVKKEKTDDHWLKIRIGHHKLEKSKHYPNDKYKTDDVDVDVYKVDGKWEPRIAFEVIEDRYGSKSS